MTIDSILLNPNVEKLASEIFKAHFGREWDPFESYDIDRVRGMMIAIAYLVANKKLKV